jgi:hypothetical protein
MSALPKKKQFVGIVIKLSQWFDLNKNTCTGRNFMTAQRALYHQGRELHEETEAYRKNYCVACHRDLRDEEDGA